MIEDGRPHAILARLGSPDLHLHAVLDLGPEAVIIPHPPSKGTTQGMKWSQFCWLFFSLMVWHALFRSLGLLDLLWKIILYLLLK